MNVSNDGQEHSQSSAQQQKMPRKHGIWTPEEDASLREAIKKHGTRWASVALEVGTRSGEQCAKRWNENLNPELDHSPWTPEEEACLLQLVQIYGHNWKFMADNMLRPRAPLAIKNRHTLLMRRFKRLNSAQRLLSINKSASKSQFCALGKNDTLPTPPSSTSTDTKTGYFDVKESQFPHSVDEQRSLAPEDRSAFPTATANTMIASQCNGSLVDTWRNDLSQVLPHTLAPHLWDDSDIFLHQEMSGTDLETGDMSSVWDPAKASQSLPQKHTISESSTTLPSPSTDHTGSGVSAASEEDSAAVVEYSVTCQRNRVRNAVCHLLSAAMSECEGEGQMVVTLRLSR